jgi:uncharacterized protein YjiS (DUF1127 family)
MFPDEKDKMSPPERAGSEGHSGRLSDLGKRVAHGVIEQLKIWHERRSMERELSALDDVSLSDIGLAREQIPTFVRAYPVAGELLEDMLRRLELSGGMATMLDSTYKDLLRTCSACGERGQCKRWLASGKKDESYKEFCPNSWVLDQLQRARRTPVSPA